MPSVPLLFVFVSSVLAQAAPKVNVTLYSESLCPDCQHYITTSWWDMWSDTSVREIINWGQVVWGNASMSRSGAITCQHGPAECDLNIMQVRNMVGEFAIGSCS